MKTEKFIIEIRQKKKIISNNNHWQSRIDNRNEYSTKELLPVVNSFLFINSMIQRIQTVYLLIIVILMITTLFLPLANLMIGNSYFTFDVTGLSAATNDQIELIYPSWALFALSAIIALIAMITIFLFHKRILQIRLCIFNAILLLGFYGLFIYQIWDIKQTVDSMEFFGKIALTFPLICLILNYLAIRNIGADEVLVRSLDRLR